MEKLVGPNVPDPRGFSKALNDVIEGLDRLFDLTKEYDLKPVSEDGVMVYSEESGKCGFQTANQYDRPSEFLQTLLDIIRVQYEPRPMGTFFLNSNIGFLFESVPKEPFRLVYTSLISCENETFESFYKNDVLPYLEKCGCDAEQITAMFAVASTGHERYKVAFVQEVSQTLQSGFSVDEALRLLASEMGSSIISPRKTTYSGYCVAPELGTRIRLSLWCFIGREQISSQ